MTRATRIWWAVFVLVLVAPVLVNVALGLARHRAEIFTEAKEARP